MKLYKIHYEVDTGATYDRDTAIVRGIDEYSAVERLKTYISNTGYEHMVSEIFSVEEFSDAVFSSRFVKKGR